MKRTLGISFLWLFITLLSATPNYAMNDGFINPNTILNQREYGAWIYTADMAFRVELSYKDEMLSIFDGKDKSLILTTPTPLPGADGLAVTKHSTNPNLLFIVVYSSNISADNFDDNFFVDRIALLLFNTNTKKIFRGLRVNDLPPKAIIIKILVRDDTLLEYHTNLGIYGTYLPKN